MNLVHYLVSAMLAWAPASEHAPESKTDVIARYKSIANDVVTVSWAEAPLMGDRVRTSVFVLSIAFLESHFAKAVDYGACNLSPRMAMCDGGIAYSMWQIHVGPGIVLLPGSWRYATNADNIVIRGPNLIADRPLAVTVAMRMLRDSLDKHKSLCAYTGEPCTGPAPKAEYRLKWGMNWFKSHPFEPGRPDNE